MEENQNLVKKFSNKENKTFNFKKVAFTFLAVSLGIVSGYFLSSRQAVKKEEKSLSREVKSEEIKKGTIVGISDEKTFKDSAEGKLEKGGIDGEGSHHLIRPGGESQTVYLTSSVIDLDKFSGRRVKVWGETFSAKKAGWLMDVGKLKVLE